MWIKYSKILKVLTNLSKTEIYLESKRVSSGNYSQGVDFCFKTKNCGVIYFWSNKLYSGSAKLGGEIISTLRDHNINFKWDGSISKVILVDLKNPRVKICG